MEDTRKTIPAGSPPPKLPNYITDVYHWAYVEPKNVEFFDSSSIMNLILFGNMNRLIKATLKEIKPEQKVLQPATVYGNLILRLAKHIGAKGKLDVLDVTPIKVDCWKSKLADFTQANVYHADAGVSTNEHYDVVNCFFLLREAPESKKKKIVNTLLESTTNSGKVVFIDYHKPCKFHPLKLLVLHINRILEPFAESLWSNSIQSYADDDESFNWTTETYFGGLYQKTIATRCKGVK